jgi:hypothetical protein
MVLLAGCSNTVNENNKVIETVTSNLNDSINEETPYEIVATDIEFEGFEELINSVKGTEKHFIINETEENYYIAISSGEKPTDGYEIEIESVKVENGRLIIVVEEINPERGSFLLDALTYPTKVIEVNKNEIIDISVRNTKNDKYSFK